MLNKQFTRKEIIKNNFLLTKHYARAISLLIASIFIPNILFSQETVDESLLNQNKTFNTGEYLRYSISYGFLDAGTASLYVDLFKDGPTDIYHVSALAETSKLAQKAFTIHDIYESFIDVKTGMPIMAVRNIHEEKYTYYDETRFDRKKKKVMSLRNGEVTVPDSILDILSAFYYARRFKFEGLKVDSKISFTTYFDDEIFTFSLIYKGVTQLKTKQGYVECKKFVPIVQTGRLFKKKDAVTIWITNDNNRIPVKVQLKMIFGTVNCDLVEHSGVANELTVEKNKKKIKKDK